MRTAEEIALEIASRCVSREKGLRFPNSLCNSIEHALIAFRNEGIEEAEKIIEQASAMPVFGLECSQYVASVFKDLLNKIRALKK